MSPLNPPERRDVPLEQPPDEPQPPNPTLEQADDDEPAYDEVEIVDTDEFGEPIEEWEADEDADDWDKTEI
jgi:hypothetical protein